MEQHQSGIAENLSGADEAPAKQWHKPVLTVIEASSAENGPGALPDSGGIDFS